MQEANQKMHKNGAFFNEKNSSIEVRGSIHFDNVMAVLAEGNALMKPLKTIKIDLKGLDQFDSSALALLTAWVAEAKKQHKVVQFLNIPKFMQAILKVCSLEDVLPIVWES